MLIISNPLNSKQLNDLSVLRKLCVKNDGSAIPTYEPLLSAKRELLSLLYYQNNQLVGFASPFHFHDKAYEIVIMVAPVFRQQGIAKKLFKAVLQETKKQFDYLSFPMATNHDQEKLIKKGFTYDSTELELRYAAKEFITLAQEITVNDAQAKDMDALATIDKCCFNSPEEEMHNRFKQLLEDKKYNLLVARLNNKIIGKLNITWGSKKATISDIAILPEYQGRGYGKQLVAFAVNHVLKKKERNIYLSVEASNVSAVKIYRKLHFNIKNSYEFWSLERKYCLPLLEKA
jgi:ribosomal protein S18 acetylase RimI-like enzyme